MKGVKVKTINIDVLEEKSVIKALIEALGKKLFTGETLFHNVFEGPGEVWLSPSLPGDTVFLELKGEC